MCGVCVWGWGVRACVCLMECVCAGGKGVWPKAIMIFDRNSSCRYCPSDCSLISFNSRAWISLIQFQKFYDFWQLEKRPFKWCKKNQIWGGVYNLNFSALDHGIWPKLAISPMNFDDTIWKVSSKLSEIQKIVEIECTKFKSWQLKESPNHWMDNPEKPTAIDIKAIQARRCPK